MTSAVYAGTKFVSWFPWWSGYGCTCATVFAGHSAEFAGHSAADDKNVSGERVAGATFITIGFRDVPDELLKGCGAAGRPCVRPLAHECNERPARGGRVKCLPPLLAGVL